MSFDLILIGCKEKTRIFVDQKYIKQAIENSWKAWAKISHYFERFLSMDI